MRKLPAVTIATARRRISRYLVAAVSVSAVAGCLTFSAVAQGASGPQLYGVLTKAQFVNTADGVVRGDLSNPFNIDSGKLAPPVNGKGPLPGDTALFELKLYHDANREDGAGSASYNCTYDFNQKGECEANVILNGGTMFASGPVDFKKGTFTLAVTGGTGNYSGVTGEVIVTQYGTVKGRDETRLMFVTFN